MPRRVAWLALLLACIASALSAQLVEVPYPSLEVVEPAVRAQLEGQRSDLDEKAAARSVDDATLGALFGGMGELYLTYDLVEAARASLQNAESLAPSFRWRYLLGTAYQLDNQIEDAARFLESALELRPQDGSTLMRLGELYLRQERLDVAQAYFARAELIEDFGAAAKFGLGRIAAERGDAALAAALFSEALLLQPGADLVHFHLGQAYRDLGDREKSQEHFAKRGELEVRYPDPIALELQGAATGVGAWLTLGRMSMSANLLDIAEERFRRAVSIDPSSAAAHLSLASALQRQGRIEESIVSYEESVRLDPENVGMRHFLAQLLARSRPANDAARAREYDERAAAHLNEVVARAPDFYEGYVELAGVRERLGDVKGALEATQRAARLRPGAPDIEIYRSALLLQDGRREEAVAVLDVFAEAELPTVAQELRLGMLLEELGLSERARRRYETVAEAPDAAPEASEAAGASNQVLAHFRLGNLLVEAGELEAAVVSFQQAVAGAPQLTEAQFNLGTVLGRLGRFEEAANHHGLVLLYETGNHPARFAEAMALLLAGQDAVAKQRLESAVRLYPREPAFAHLLARVLVASADESVREPAAGLELAGRLMDTIPSLDHAETLAMALATNGETDRAAELQRQVVSELEKANRPELEAARGRLGTYERGDVVRSPWSGG